MGKLSDKELSVLFPEREVVIGGEQFTIRPFSFGETRKVISQLKELAAIVDSDTFGSVESIVDVVVNSGDSVLSILQMAYKKDPEWFDALDNASALKAIYEVVDINRHFFVETVIKAVPELGKLMTKTAG